MAYWQLQLNPENESITDEVAFLKNNSFIGLHQNEEASVIKAFKNELHYGDIVLIHHDQTPIALVKALGKEEAKESTNKLFSCKHKVVLLTFLQQEKQSFLKQKSSFEKVLTHNSKSYNYIHNKYQNFLTHNPLKPENLLQSASLNGHSDSVNALVKLSENTFASASDDSTIKIWDSKTSTELATLKGHSGFVYSLVKLSENTFASGSWDKTIKIWDSNNFTELATLEAHSDSVHSLVKLSENTFASGSNDATIKVWDSKTFTELATLEAHSDSVRSLVKLSENTFASASNDATIKIWDSNNFTELATLKAHFDSVRSLVKLSENTFASASWDDTIKIWDSSNFTELATLEAHSGFAYSLVKLSESTFASGSNDGTIKIWDSNNFTELATLKAHFDSVRSLVKLSENTFASASWDNTIKIWGSNNFTELETLKGHSYSVRSLVKLSETTFASGYFDGTIKIWDSKTFTELTTLEAHSDSVYSLVKLSETTFASGSYDGTIKIWDSNNFTELETLKAHSYSVNALVKLSETTFASGSDDGNIKIWDSKTFTELTTLEAHSDSVRALVKLSETTFASGYFDGTIKIWDSNSFTELETLKAHSGPVNSLVKLSETTFASSSWDDTIKIWDSNTFTELFSIDKASRHLVYENKHLFIGDAKGDISILNMQDLMNPKEIELSFNAKSAIEALAVQDGTLLFSTLAGDLYVEQLNLEKEVASKSHVQNRLHIKTLLLGDSGVGKTTLGYWLEHAKYNSNIHSTHGMRFFNYSPKQAIKLHNTPHEANKEQLVSFDIWDFGGQPEYQIAHKQNFDEARLIFLVVDLERKDNSIPYWINSIKEHLSKTKQEELNVFIIGTKTHETSKLEEVKKSLLLNLPSLEEKVQTLVLDVTQEHENSELIKAMHNFVTQHVRLEQAHILTANALIVLEQLKSFQKSRFYFENEESILPLLKKHKTVNADNLQAALKALVRDGSVEYLDSFILLRPYWKNIFATELLRKAEHNQMVRASLSLSTLFTSKLDISFDKLFEYEKTNTDFISDQELYEKTFLQGPKQLRKRFLQEVLTNFLQDKICYLKNGMLVFPSRFKHKPNGFDKSAYFKLESLKLVSKKQVEVSIGVLVSSFAYSKHFKVLKHLDKGVKLQDAKGCLYLIEFERKDIFTQATNQHTTHINLFAKNNIPEQNQELVHFVKLVLQESLSAVYEQKNFYLTKHNTTIGELLLTVEPDESETVQELFKDKTLELHENIEEKSTCDKRMLSEVEENVQASIQKVQQKCKQLSEASPQKTFRFLHLSDLHFEEKTDVENEFFKLKQDFLEEGKALCSIDYLILSGDLSAKAKAGEFKKVALFITKLIDACGIDAQKVMVVAGNHDYSRDVTHEAYAITNYSEKAFSQNEDFKIDDRIFLKRDKTKWEQKFKYFSEHLYEHLYNHAYETKDGVKLMEDETFSFVLLNSSKKIDHFWPRKVHFDVEAFIGIQNSIKKSNIKFAIAHHPINYEQSYEFINNLHYYGFKGYFHGHVHRNYLVSFQDVIASQEKLIQVGSGLFYSTNPKSHLQAVPLRYNIITVNIEDEKAVLEVETRERESTLIPWAPASLYPQENRTRSHIWKESL